MSDKQKTFQEIDITRMFPDIENFDEIYVKLPDVKRENYKIQFGYDHNDLIEGKITLRISKNERP